MPTATCAPCQARAYAASTQAPALPPPAVPGGTRWSGVLAVENQITGDMPARVFKPNVLTWDTNATWPLSIVFQSTEGHDNSVVCGTIDSITRGQKGQINATGSFDMGSANGQEAARVVGENIMNWVSVDLDDVTMEVWVKSDLMAEDPLLLMAAAGDPLPNQTDYETLVELAPDDEIHVITAARIRGATLVHMSAFADAQIHVESPGDAGAAGTQGMGGMMPDGQTTCSCDEADSDYQPDCMCPPPAEAVTAAAATLAPEARPWAVQIDPPGRFFSTPRLERATPLTITDEGWVYGHAFAWGTCHIAYVNQGECILPPRSHSKYAYFHTGSILTAEKSLLASGRITLGTIHAGKNLSAAQTLAHYEDTGLGAVDLRMGEDSFGGWVGGGLRPKVTREQVRELRASPLSGDWRRIGGHLELVAVLAVNVAGFPIPRPEALVASGQVQSLTAAGMVLPGMMLPREVIHTARSRYTVLVPGPPAESPGGALARRVQASRLAMRVRHPVRSA